MQRGPGHLFGPVMVQRQVARLEQQRLCVPGAGAVGQVLADRVAQLVAVVGVRHHLVHAVADLVDDVGRHRLGQRVGAIGGRVARIFAPGQ